MNKQKQSNYIGIPHMSDQNFNLNTSFSQNSIHYFNSINISQNQNNRTQSKNNLKQQKQSINSIINQSMNNNINTNNDNSTLVKSKDVLNKFNSKLNAISIKNKSIQKQYSVVKKQIQHTTQEINKHLDKKIQNTFNKLLHKDTIMPTNLLVNSQTNQQKENFVPNCLSVVDGTKILMAQYWEKDYHKHIIDKNKPSSQQTNSRIQDVSNLPKITQKSHKKQKYNHRTSQLNKLEKKKEQQLKNKNQQLTMQFLTFIVQIIDYKIRNQSNDFLVFQRINFKKLQDIQFILNCLQKFAQHYEITYGKIKLKRVLQILQHNQKIQNRKASLIYKRFNQNQKKVYQIKTQYSVHQLLSCFQDAEKISQQYLHSKGIRFFGNKGKKRAIIKIQSQMRKYLAMKKYKQLKNILSKVILIQRKFRQHIQYLNTKQKIFTIQIEKIQKYQQIQKQFRQNFKKNEITKKVKYEIHICSLSLSQWQRVTSENPNQVQNTQISRIFRIALKSSLLMQTRIIYITPTQLPQQIINYYKKVFEFGWSEDNDVSDKLNFIWPQNIEKLSQTLSLTQKVLYSKTAMKRLKKFTKNNYCYIVPSKPSNDFISLSYQLNVPLYCSEPQKLLYLQTKAGTKELTKVLAQSREDGFGILPYSSNIYNKKKFISELSSLVFNYPQVRKWVLKIDNQHESRGLAYIDTSKILKKQLITRILQRKSTKQNEKVLKQQVQNALTTSIITYAEQRIIPLNKQIYKCQQQYLNHFLSYGGIIQASINNLQTDLDNYCFCIQIYPDNQWQFVTKYYKLTYKNKAIGCYYDSNQSIQPPIQIQTIVKELIKKNLFGYFTLEFLRIPQEIDSNNNLIPKRKSNNLIYFNGIQCHLDKFASASFLRQFLSKETNVLYIPKLQHPSLKQLRMQTFFHLCRLQNISFDMERKIGNVFMFLGGLQTGCMGLMSFNQNSKNQTFQQVSDVLQFLSTKLDTSITKKLSKGFLAIKNVVNGYLKRDHKNNKLNKKGFNISQSINSLQALKFQ